MNLEKKIRKAMAKLEYIRMGGPRMWFAHPDLCLYLSSWPMLGWRFLRKRGAARGHLCLSLGWLSATVTW
jgi:hypothetical protein